MNEFDFSRRAGEPLSERWPRGEDGVPEEPAFLCRCSDTDLSDVLTVNMLEAYDIPCLRVYPGDGSFGHVVLGISYTGVDILVPSSLLEDAKALIDAKEGEETHEEL